MITCLKFLPQVEVEVEPLNRVHSGRHADAEPRRVVNKLERNNQTPNNIRQRVAVRSLLVASHDCTADERPAASLTFFSLLIKSATRPAQHGRLYGRFRIRRRREQ